MGWQARLNKLKRDAVVSAYESNTEIQHLSKVQLASTHEFGVYAMEIQRKYPLFMPEPPGVKRSATELLDAALVLMKLVTAKVIEAKGEIDTSMLSERDATKYKQKLVRMIAAKKAFEAAGGTYSK